MAASDLYGLEASGLPPELVAKVMGAKRQQQIAQALLEHSMGGIKNMGGPGAKLSWTQGLAQLAQAYQGRSGLKEAEDAMAAAASEKQRGVADALAQYQRTRFGSPDQVMPQPVAMDDDGNAMPAAVKSGVKGDVRRAITEAMMNPYLANSPLIAAEAKGLQPMNLGRSAVVPATGEVLATDSTWAEEQRANREARDQQLRQQHEQKLQELRLRSEDRRLAEQDRQAARVEMARLVASLRPQQQTSPLVSVQGPDGRPVLVTRDEAVGKTPAGNRVEKALPAPLQKQLTEAAELSDATTRFASTFKDDFGGKTITGNLSNTMGRLLGDDTGQSQWWQDYELHQSQIRNKLFGSALTTAEMAAWEKSAINPRMEAKQIKANLERRKQLEDKALGRLMNGAIAGGYNREQIEAYTGRSEAPSGATSLPAASDEPPPGAVRRKGG
jgi:hypothetical protein